jgi:hypothetical protein
MLALTRAVGKILRIEPAVTRIPFAQVREIGPCVEVDVDAGSTQAMRTERWLGEHLICRIPGAAGKKRK